MRNSWKLGLCAALGASVTFVGCSSGDNLAPASGGSGGSGTSTAGKGGSAGGTTLNISGSSTGGSSSSAGTSSGGTSAGTTTGGTTTAGSAGKAGSGGSGGTTTGGSGGASAGSGGTGGTSGSAGSGGSLAGSGGSLAGSGGLGGSGGSAGTCDDGDGFTAAGAGGAGSVVTAIVLVDNVVVKDGAAAAYKSWLFADATDIVDDKVGNVGDKWVRFPFDAASIGNNAGAHDVFSKCDGNPKGSLKNVVPFTMAGQYYETGVGFAGHDWSNFTVAADVKLVSGGNSQAACAAHAELFINGAAGPTTGPSKLLTAGAWVSLALTAPATGATSTDHIGVRITSYTCL